MSVSVHAVGVRDLDAEFDKMFELASSCHDAMVSLPKEVQEYFEDYLDEYGSLPVFESKLNRLELERYMFEEPINGDGIVIDGGHFGGDGMIIDLSSLPSDIHKIRIYAL